jgi:SAM-dependent methyltransferase
MPSSDRGAGDAALDDRAPAMAEWLTLLVCPTCGGDLTARSLSLTCGQCATAHALRGGIPSLLAAERTDGPEWAAGASPTETVRRFYTEAPFPGYRANDTLASLRARAERSPFARLLDQAIPADARVLELGCGTGQMTLFLASDRRRVVGADLTRASLELGERAARRFGSSRALFLETDLHHPGLRPGAFDVVVSLGVLHHTPDPSKAFSSLARLARPGGIIVVGLYNAFARLPHRLRRLVARLSGMRVIPLDPVLRDRRTEPERRKAWIRDQYLHPQEHRHTLHEVQRWFRDQRVEYLRTYPSALVGEGDSPEAEASLFCAAQDNWWPEGLLAQLGWMRTLGSEGGLFITVGRRL